MFQREKKSLAVLWEGTVPFMNRHWRQPYTHTLWVRSNHVSCLSNKKIKWKSHSDIWHFFSVSLFSVRWCDSPWLFAKEGLHKENTHLEFTYWESGPWAPTSQIPPHRSTDEMIRMWVNTPDAETEHLCNKGSWHLGQNSNVVYIPKCHLTSCISGIF